MCYINQNRLSLKLYLVLNNANQELKLDKSFPMLRTESAVELSPKATPWDEL